MYYFSKAVILVHFFIKFGVLGILCRIIIFFSIANNLNVNFSILIIWIREFCYRLAVIMWFQFGRVSSSSSS